MTYTTSTHLNFDGNARAVLEFYRSVFGGDLTIATYADFGMPAEVPGSDRVVFGQVSTATGFTVMAYDAPAQGEPSLVHAPVPTTRRENGTTLTDSRFFLSVRGETVDEMQQLWDSLADSGTVVEPLGPAQWAPAFGMLTDQFGVTWILDVAAQY